MICITKFGKNLVFQTEWSLKFCKNLEVISIFLKIFTGFLANLLL